MYRFLLISFFASYFSFNSGAQVFHDDFEGNGNIHNWLGDDCGLDTNYINPYIQGVNPSAHVLQYTDSGGQYANVRFDSGNNLNMAMYKKITLKVYVPSSGITGNQNNQISLKLQDGSLSAPWSTQCEIIKPLTLNQWQSVSFDFQKDAYINLDPNSLPPTQRNDFNRVVIQINGENNTDQVIAYIDDFSNQDTSSSQSNYTFLSWSDEFNGNGAIDSSKWHHQTLFPNGGSWFNGEVQHYTNRQDNSFVSNGYLHIVAKKENFTDQGVTKQYTSARLNSKFAFQYGKVEIRAQLPSGVGTWPALWMLGKNIDEDGAYWDLQGYGNTNWPACGEIDIMEHWGENQNFVQSALHTPSSSGNTMNKGGQTVPTASTAFHTYTLLWTPNEMIFSVDSVIHYTYAPSIYNSSTWPFNAEQYILFNFAVLPHIDVNFQQDTLKVDYIRIYQHDSVSAISHAKQNLLDLNILPNPIHDQAVLHFRSDYSSVTQIHIYDLNGKLMDRLPWNTKAKTLNEVSLDFSNYSPGMYIVQLHNTYHNVVKKIIIK
jgi:beta-glucanase (GH16 family)